MAKEKLSRLDQFAMKIMEVFLKDIMKDKNYNPEINMEKFYEAVAADCVIMAKTMIAELDKNRALLDTGHEMAQGLREAGIIDDKEMKKFGVLCDKIEPHYNDVICHCPTCSYQRAKKNDS